MSGSPIIKMLLELAMMAGLKSNPLNHLRSILLILCAIALGLNINVPNWVGLLLPIIGILVLLAYLFVFFYSMFKDKDFLRSDSYSLNKMLIKREAYKSIPRFKTHVKSATPQLDSLNFSNIESDYSI